MNPIRIGTRSSKLALWQAQWVARELKKFWPQLDFTLVPIKTTGDIMTEVSLSQIGGKALFVKEIESALLESKVDLAVHSMKDVPTQLPAGLSIQTIPPREDARDALISFDGQGLMTLPKGSRVGSSSLRRLSQLKRKRPDLKFENLRGNVDTRLDKIKSREFDAVILAAAGLKRLGFEAKISEYLDTIPAVAQGALGIETRSDDDRLIKWLKPLHHPESGEMVSLERLFLQIMEGGCQVPLGCHAVLLPQDQIQIKAFVADPEGKQFLERNLTVDRAQAADAVRKMSHELLAAGGAQILKGLKKM